VPHCKFAFWIAYCTRGRQILRSLRHLAILFYFILFYFCGDFKKKLRILFWTKTWINVFFFSVRYVDFLSKSSALLRGNFFKKKWERKTHWSLIYLHYSIYYSILNISFQSIKIFKNSIRDFCFSNRYFLNFFCIFVNTPCFLLFFVFNFFFFGACVFLVR